MHGNNRLRILGLPLALLFGYWFGAMETMVPVMQAAMWSGMVVGMWQAMAELRSGRADAAYARRFAAVFGRAPMRQSSQVRT